MYYMDETPDPQRVKFSEDHHFILELIRSEDRLVQTIQLEGCYADRSRFLCVVCRQGQERNDYCLLGVDLDDQKEDQHATVGLVFKLFWNTKVTLDGDGGFSIRQNKDTHFIFKPVSVQALWTVIQTLHMISERLSPIIDDGGSCLNNSAEGWPCYYYKVESVQSCINEWHAMADLLVKRPESTRPYLDDQDVVIKCRLREVMKTVDLDTMTSKKIRGQLEQVLDTSLEAHKSFIDEEILVILGQMDPASRILDYLYLGSEWNASNLDELRQNGITHILNVTREIDNFFPASFKYKNVRVYDEEATDLLHHFDDTFRFLKTAKEEKGGRALVHCKMGISRSATCTVSYLMKVYEMDLKDALNYTKSRRPVVNPNRSFLKQLEVYEGILGAIRHRHIYRGLFRSKSESSIVPNDEDEKDKDRDNKKVLDNNVDGQEDHLQKINHNHPSVLFNNAAASQWGVNRPKSWSPSNKVSKSLLFDRDMVKSCHKNQEECRCSSFEESRPYNSPVNSSVPAYNPLCDCDVELELAVPVEPVNVTGNHEQDDRHTQVVVQNLSQLPLQMRTNSLLEEFRGGGPTINSPTTPIFMLKRRSSVGGEMVTPSQQPQQQQQQPCGRKRHNKEEELSVKTLANMFDFKVNSIPYRPCSAKLEDNKIFQKAAKQLDKVGKKDNESKC